MNWDQIMPAIFMIAVLILVLPSFLRTNSKLKQFPGRSQFKNHINDLQNIEEVYKNWLNVQNYINLDNKIIFTNDTDFKGR